MFWLVLIACSDSPSGRANATETPLKLHTDDGSTIALNHHPGDGRPVLLVHGISSNHHYWDIDPEHSLADWLVASGRDVWLLDLRGHGDAEIDLSGEAQRYGWTIDDYGRHDVPTAVAWILSVTGAPQVDYVGHSLGGMVGAIYATTGGADRLASMVVLGSPAAFRVEDPLHTAGSLALTGGGVGLLWFDTPFFAGLATAVDRILPVVSHQHLFNPDNVDQTTVRRVFHRATSPLSRNEMAQLGQMMRDERFESADRRVDYAEALGEVRVPTLAIGGTADQVVPPGRVEAFAAAMGGEQHYVEAGRAAGMAQDYGHLDFVIGSRAPGEIFPMIGDWIDGDRPAPR